MDTTQLLKGVLDLAVLAVVGLRHPSPVVRRRGADVLRRGVHRHRHRHPPASGGEHAHQRHHPDLGPDEREELLGGLAADVFDLVVERGPEALGDPEPRPN